MIFSIVILVLLSVSASQDEVKPDSPTTQTSTDMKGPGDTSESQTTTQQTTTLQSTSLPQQSVLTTFKSGVTTVESTETTFPEKTNSTVTEQSKISTTQTATNTTDPGDTSESQTTTQQIIIQQTTTDVTSNTQTTSLQSTWLSQKSILTTSESAITTVDSTDTTLPEKPNNTITDQGDREEQDVAVNPGLVAVLCIFGIVVAVIVVVVIVKALRSRSPQFERLDDVPMGKMNENAPFAHYPPK